MMVKSSEVGQPPLLEVSSIDKGPFRAAYDTEETYQTFHLREEDNDEDIDVDILVIYWVSLYLNHRKGSFCFHISYN